MTQVPSYDDFIRLANGKLAPLVASVSADLETPVSVYWKLAHHSKHSFLLESVTGGEHVARYSYLGIDPEYILEIKDGLINEVRKLEEHLDPLHILEEALQAFQHENWPGLPPFVGGSVGFLSYDIVRYFEPIVIEGLCVTPDLAMMMIRELIAFDHARNQANIIILTQPDELSYLNSVKRINHLVSMIKAPLPVLPEPPKTRFNGEVSLEKAEFEDIVKKGINYINNGDCIQVVLSRKVTRRTEAHPFSLYRQLRITNPSPYMFLMRFGDYDIVGASPELLVSLHDRTASVRPIAGTRPRGTTEMADNLLAHELLEDEKECAEHIMLVDLGRNDLGRVCEIGSVQVTKLMQVERYSHVMHIVSDVYGQLSSGKSSFDLVRSTFPAGTLSGAPKVRAMQIIQELEPTKRGLYGGAIGVFSPLGNVDLAIAIRSIYIENGIATVQAGAGIVTDSVPSSEYEETIIKSGNAIAAIDCAEQLIL